VSSDYIEYSHKETTAATFFDTTSETLILLN